MKKLLSTLCLLLVAGVVLAQCPNTSITAPGMHPDTLLTPGVINQAYGPVDLQVVIPRAIDTTLTISGFPVQARIVPTSAEVTGSVGIPAGMNDIHTTYTGANPLVLDTARTTPANMCFTFSGRPTEAGNFRPGVNILIDGWVSVSGLPFSIPELADPILLSNPPAELTTPLGVFPFPADALEPFRNLPATTGYKVNSGASISNTLAADINLRVFPNPGTQASQVAFTLAAGSNVRVELVDMTGRMVNVIVDGTLAAGSHSYAICAGCGELPKGIYFVKTAVNGSFTSTTLSLN